MKMSQPLRNILSRAPSTKSKIGLGALVFVALFASPSLAIFNNLNLGKLVKSVDFSTVFNKKKNDNDSDGGIGFGGGDIFKTNDFNPNANDDGSEKQNKFNPSYGGISLSDLTKKDRTEEDDINLFTNSVDLLFSKTTGRDTSPYTKILGSFLGSLSRKSAKDTDDILTGHEGQDDLGSGAGSDGIGQKLSDVQDIVGAIGVLIPEKVRSAAKQEGYLGSGGGIFGVNRAIQTDFMAELTETETINQSINSLFSEEGQVVTAQLQSAVEETAFKAAEIADETQAMKASLDVNKAMTGQLAVIATNQNATFAEALQNRLATVQGNQLAAKLVKIENQRVWDEKIQGSATKAGNFKAASGFAALVDVKAGGQVPDTCTSSNSASGLGLPPGAALNVAC